MTYKSWCASAFKKVKFICIIAFSLSRFIHNRSGTKIMTYSLTCLRNILWNRSQVKFIPDVHRLLVWTNENVLYLAVSFDVRLFKQTLTFFIYRLHLQKQQKKIVIFPSTSLWVVVTIFWFLILLLHHTIINCLFTP